MQARERINIRSVSKASKTNDIGGAQRAINANG